MGLHFSAPLKEGRQGGQVSGILYRFDKGALTLA